MNLDNDPDHSVGFVVIGRNEGGRLEASLTAIKSLFASAPVVYVDSGSTDNSVNFALSLQFEVVELDISIPFTAARARNAGFNRLIEKHSNIKFVQFLDGDCILQPGWIEAAVQKLSSDDAIGIVSGRRAEKFVDHSIYNALMDIEWDTPVGETKAVPGDMCVKSSVFQEIQGFSDNIIAAEDDDLCIRSRAAGYKVFRVGVTMSYHDANITKLSQWYKRSKRCGHGYANINHLHGNAPEFYFRRNLISAFIWGAVVPITSLGLLIVYPLLALMVLLVYGLFVLKTSLRRLTQGFSLKLSLAYGFLIYSGKIPECLGIAQYWKNHLSSHHHQLIEYK